MAERTFPNVGLKGGYAAGEDGWGASQNANLLALSALVQGTVISKVSATPGAPVNLDVYLFDQTHPTQPNKIAIFENAVWTYITAKEGWLVYNQDKNYYEKFDGTWAELATGGGGGGAALPFKGALLKLTATEAVAAAVDVPVPWDAAEYQSGATFWAIGTPTRFTIPAGVTKVILFGNLTRNSVADQLYGSIKKNGANFNLSPIADTETSGGDSINFVSAPLDVVPGDYFELVAFTPTASDLQIAGTWFGIEAVEQAPIAGGQIHVREVQASGVAGSASVAAWTNRVLNTTVLNTISGALLAGNQITLPPGTYDISAVMNVFSAASMGHKARLRDITNGITLLEGMTSWGGASVERGCRLQGRFTLTAITVVACQMIATGVVAAGWGVNSGIAAETNILADVMISVAGYASNALVEALLIGVTDEITALTTGVTKMTFRMPYGFIPTEVRASLTTAQAAGTIFTVDLNENGVSFLSTKLTIDNTEKTSKTAAIPPVISDPILGDDSEITVDIDQIGDGSAKGLKILIIGRRG